MVLIFNCIFLVSLSEVFVISCPQPSNPGIRLRAEVTDILGDLFTFFSIIH